MKKSFAILAILSALCSVSGQTTSSWFTVTEIQQNVWTIDDHKAVNVYVIVGNDSALVIDTGIGTADLIGQIAKLTDKPLIVVNTHGHPDHSGANYQFGKVWVHPADSADARTYNLPERREAAAKTMLKGEKPSSGEQFTGKTMFTRYLAVRDGHIFDLGSRTVEVWVTPGHTPGSICLLDVESKLLFTGDNNNGLVWLFLPNCRPLHEYLVTLEMQVSRLSRFDTIVPGHGVPMASDFVKDQATCVRSIIEGKCEPKPYGSFAGNAMLCSFGKASVAYNPDNL